MPVRLPSLAFCAACSLVGFAVGFTGVQLERLAGLGLTALVAVPLAYAIARVWRRFHGPVVVEPVVLRVVKVEPPSDEPPRAA